MENFNIYNIPEFQDQEIQKLCQGLQNAFVSKQNAFALTCFYVNQIHSYFKGKYIPALNKEHYNSYGLLALFGFDKIAVSRLKRCFYTFCVGELPTSVHLEMWASGFSPSKLFELLALGEKETILGYIEKKLIRPDMTIKQLRQTIKDILGKASSSKTEEINEEDIPMAYDPTQKYHMDYFVKKSRPELLNIIMTLQDAHQKLLEKKGRK